MHELNKHSLIIDYIQKNHFGDLLGITFTILDKGVVEYYLVLEEKHLATPNAAHGGCIAALLDATLGVGALTLFCEEEKVVSTLEMKVAFLNAAKIGDKLIAKSQVLKKGTKLVFMEAEVINAEGINIAKASATLNAFPKEFAGYS